MANFIHSRNTENGILYRLWSTMDDCYITQELTQQKLHDLLEQEALRQFEEDFKKRVARANQFGTSSQIDDPRDMNKGWDQELDEI
jgi:hypothetical protein